MSIRRRRLGRTGLEVSELGFGCSSFWAKRAFPEKDALALLHAAIERGVTLMDTGSSYASGQAEIRLGKALCEHRREDIVVSTKAGTRISAAGRAYKDFRPASIRDSVEQSLKRLQLDCIPILNLHAPEPENITDELLGELERLRSEGLVRFCGVHGASERLHEIVLRHDLFSIAMYDYNLLHSDRRQRITELVAAGKAFLGATPLAQALFSNKIFMPTRLADVWYLLRALKNHRDEIIRGFSFRFVNGVPGWSGGEVALAYALSNHDVSVAIFGTTSMKRLLENIAVSGRELPEEIIRRIEAV